MSRCLDVKKVGIEDWKAEINDRVAYLHRF